MEFTQDFFDFFYNKTGIVFSEKRRVASTKIKNFAQERGYEEARDFERDVKQKPALLQDLIDMLSTNETYFFREMKGFEIFLNLIDIGKENKILIIPCSTGEEAYTMSILLNQKGYKNFKITACDINSSVIQSAKEGRYKLKNFREDSQMISKYFIKEEDDFIKIKPIYKENITFLKQNIFESDIKNLGTFDFIFCRNLFIYFDKQSKLKAQDAIHGLLKEKGILIMGHADYPEEHYGFQKIYNNGTYYYQRTA